MKKYKISQISYKNYASEFKDCKIILKNEQWELLYTRSIVSRKKHLLLRRFNCHQQQISLLISQLKYLESVNCIASINKCLGYTIENHVIPSTSNKIANLFILFEFAEISLDNLVQSSAQRSRGESLNLVQLICDRLSSAAMSLSHNNIEMRYLSFDLKLISVGLNGEAAHQVQFTYLPFDFLYQTSNATDQFKTHIYSIQDLNYINEKERKNEIETIFRKNQHKRLNILNLKRSYSEVDMLQKIGLLLTKLILLICQEVHFREAQLDLYDINKKFKIDYNWALINPLIAECSKQKEYKKIANIIQSMLFNYQKEGFQQFRSSDIAFDSSNECNTLNNLSSQYNIKDSRVKNTSQAFAYNNLEGNQLFKQKQFSHNYSQSRIPSREDIFKKKEEIERKVEKLSDIAQIYHQNGKYFGQTKNGKREGLGIFYFNEGQIYGGEWRNNEMIGEGLYLFLSQNQYYEGHVDCGTRSGYGCYYYRDRRVYRGEWRNDLKEGHGEFFSAESEEIYKGNFKNNLQEGIGIICYPNGSRFQGSFSKGLKNGKGCMYNAQGGIALKAFWVNDELSGKGQIFFENGDYFKGDLVDGYMHGEGMYEYKCGTIYNGNFILNQMQGSCNISYSNGDTYQGQIKNGKFNRKGSYLYNRVRLIEQCDWSGGYQIGEALFIREDKKYIGMMKDHKLESALIQIE